MNFFSTLSYKVANKIEFLQAQEVSLAEIHPTSTLAFSKLRLKKNCSAIVDEETIVGG
jgi:hypothetical protein